ncbi:VWA domain-containing protein [Algiphilus sp. W345]|uniref:VWA domain-containing protein n=1 Tax=Banduia mediterranea TaxID=3075609 RepID=A0ABU2WE79_9GAMM|nr:VWA domain-containing protein [Algiphilus sp. W345]MDT0496155.1 VWA domain-containing protein [Algiphilus sp. W345]
MLRTLEEFFRALRGSGLEPGLSECLDAARAAGLVGIEDRERLRDALGSTLAKKAADRAHFDEVFDRFFAFGLFAAAGAAPDVATVTEPADPQQAELPASELLRVIETRDQASLARRLRQAEQAVRLDGAWLFTQRGLYTRRMLEAMGTPALSAERSELQAALDTGRAPPGAAQRIQRLRRAEECLFEEVRDHVGRRVAMYGGAAVERLRDSALAAEPLSRIERRDFDRMRRLVHRLARRLAARHALRSRRRRRGRLDLRRTLARNAAYDGIPFETCWRRRRIDKPRLVVVCDVSRSVQAHARFLLLLLYGLRDLLPDVRSFAFTHHLVDVSERFDADPPHIAIERVLDQVGGTGTNYGLMLRDFARSELPRVDRRCAVIFLGDARNNRAAPETAVLRTLYQRARQVVWLNPEPRSFWGLGDSEMQHYAPCCHAVHECGTLAQLERAVDRLLHSAA